MLASPEYVLDHIDVLHGDTADFPHTAISPSEVAPPNFYDADLEYVVSENLKQAISIIKRIQLKFEIVFQPRHHKEEATRKFVRLINALNAFHFHFDFISEILASSCRKNVAEIVARFQSISCYYRTITKKDDICLRLIKKTFKAVIFYVLNETEKIIEAFSTLKDGGLSEINNNPEALDCVQIITSKLEIVLEYFPEAAIIGCDDIFTHKKTSQLWAKLKENVETIVLCDKESMKNRFKSFFSLLTVVSATVYKSHQIKGNSLTDKILTGLNGLYYGAKVKDAEAKVALFLSDPKMESAFSVWNLLERQWIAGLMDLKLPSISYDRKLYINRLFPAINQETILREYEDGTLNKISTQGQFKPADLSNKKDVILESIFTEQADAVKMRIISPKPLVLKGESSEKARMMAYQFMNSKKAKSQKDAQDIIIHIHGGGFVSGSSGSHRPYLYKWAKSLNRIIFSIDYRLAPDHPYPAGLDDVWQAYNWIMNYAEPVLGIKIGKVILAGDSAGGNLVMALTLRAIKSGVKLPDGCLLAYPALNLFPKKFVPSYLLALEDKVLPSTMLKLCLKAYVPEQFNPLEDPFLSPLMASDELLNKLPPIKIVTGSGDPLNGDSWKFLHRMQNLNKDVKMVIYENMPHGFLNFDQVEGYKEVIQKTGQMLEEMFQSIP